MNDFAESPIWSEADIRAQEKAKPINNPIREARAREQEREELARLFRTIELDFAGLSDELQERVVTMNEHQKTMDDDAACARLAMAVKDYRQKTGNEDPLSTEDWQHVGIASMFTDTGKSGPREATGEQSRLINVMYGEDALLRPNPAAWTVERFLNEYIKSYDTKEALNLLGEVDIPPDMSMRDFYNLHAGWSYNLIKDEPRLSKDVKVMAGLHHLLEGVNPEGLVDLSDDTLQIPSLDRTVDEREIWVMLLDKFQARLRRGGVSEEAAVGWLRDYVNKYVALKPYPAHFQSTLNRCVDDLEGMIQSSTLELAAK